MAPDGPAAPAGGLIAQSLASCDTALCECEGLPGDCWRAAMDAVSWVQPIRGRRAPAWIFRSKRTRFRAISCRGRHIVQSGTMSIRRPGYGSSAIPAFARVGAISIPLADAVELLARAKSGSRGTRV